MMTKKLVNVPPLMHNQTSLFGPSNLQAQEANVRPLAHIQDIVHVHIDVGSHRHAPFLGHGTH